MIARTSRNDDATGGCNRLKTGSKVYAVTKDVATFDDDISKCDADPKLNEAAFGEIDIADSHGALNVDCTKTAFTTLPNSASKTVACGLEDPAFVTVDSRVNDLALEAVLEECSVPTSSSAIKRVYPTASAAKMAARRRWTEFSATRECLGFFQSASL